MILIECTQCKIKKTFEEFYLNKRKTLIKEYYSIRKICKLCFKINNTKYLKLNTQFQKSVNANKKAKKNNITGTLNSKDIKNKYVFQKQKCFYCYLEIGSNYHIDHLISLSKNGKNSIENIVISCSFCNLAKNDKSISDFFYYLNHIINNRELIKQNIENFITVEQENV